MGFCRLADGEVGEKPKVFLFYIYFLKNDCSRCFQHVCLWFVVGFIGFWTKTGVCLGMVAKGGLTHCHIFLTGACRVTDG